MFNVVQKVCNVADKNYNVQQKIIKKIDMKFTAAYERFSATATVIPLKNL
jgi:hypothetical protein